MLQVLDGILEEFNVEKVILAEEIREFAPDLLDEYQKRFEGITIEFVPHSKFDQLVPKAKGIIRTGQYGLHAPNLILQSGCTYDG